MRSNRMIEKVGLTLKEFRQSRGVSMDDMAKKLNVSYQQVSKYESGANRIPVDKLYVALKLLDVTPNEFFYIFDDAGTKRHKNSKAALGLMRNLRGIEDDSVIDAIGKLVRIYLSDKNVD